MIKPLYYCILKHYKGLIKKRFSNNTHLFILPRTDYDYLYLALLGERTDAYSADSGHSFRSMAATSVGAKRRWDFKIFYRSITFRQVFVFFSWNLLSIEYDERCEPAGRG